MSNKKVFNAQLYRLPQKGVQMYIRKNLRDRGIPFKQYDGCIYSIRYPGKPIFVAHMDTVGEHDVSIDLVLLKDLGRITRDTPGILGADDKAGVNIILNWASKINFVLTRDEETGLQGAHSLAKHVPFVTDLAQCSCAIEFDRKNGDNIIQFCDSDLITDIESMCQPYKKANGSITDVSAWKHLIPAVNMSCGYYNPHSKTEYLLLEEYRRANSMVPRLNTLTGPYNLMPKPVVKSYNYASNKSYYNQAQCQCSMCQTEAGYGANFMDMYLWGDEETGLIVCEACLGSFGLKKLTYNEKRLQKYIDIGLTKVDADATL